MTTKPECIHGADPVSPSTSVRPPARVTVAVCTRDRPDTLARCLDALQRVEHPDFHVLVVDNAPMGDGACVVSAAAGVEYLLVPEPGLSRARNAAACATASGIIAYLDDDAIPEPAWLLELERPFDDPAIAAVVGQVRPRGPHSGEDHVLRVERSDAGWAERTLFGGLGIGANMAFRRSVFTSWPGFDERLGRGAVIPGGEEHEAFFALLAEGYAVAYVPAAEVYHEGSVGARSAPDLTASSAFLLHVFAKYPEARRMLLAYLLRSLTGGGPAAGRPRGAPVTTTLARIRGMCRGVLLFARSRLG
jgi:GT2 family glycosyltransferase